MSYSFHSPLSILTLIIPFFVFCCFHVLPLASSASYTYSSSSSFVVNEEADALLRWKSTFQFHNRSYSLLSTWSLSNPLSNWSGISCHTKSKVPTVSNIDLSGYGLEGTLLNLSFSSFPNLMILNLSRNSFHGNIPSHIANLSKLQVLDLSANYISGTIPKDTGNLSSISYLDLSYNNLSGVIPTSFANLTNLSVLNLRFNQLSGSIPQEIGMLKAVTQLRLSCNNLTGTIPTSIGKLKAVTHLSLAFNQLSGSIPQEVGLLKSITILTLSTNNLTGTIPSSIENLTNLCTLYHYSKSIADGNCLGGKLQYFSASNNYLSGPVPQGLANCISLIRFNLHNNQLTGNISEYFGNCPHLYVRN